MVLSALVYLVAIYLLSGLKVVYQYERGVKFTLGKFSKIMQPGLRIVFPVIQTWTRMDLRVNVVDVPDQDCISKDNVSVKVNAVLYFKVTNPEYAVIRVEDYYYAISQFAQTTMRNIVGEATLDELLISRDKISERIRTIVDKATDAWGIDMHAVELKDISLPEEMQRTMAKEAETERERRAMIIISEGEKAASKNLMEAAKILGSSKGAIHLRTLQNFNDISSDPTNTIVFAVPLEAIDALEGKR
ncbi:slipin family protein [Candidatus Woesearchaeota archaeon]|nr:slipin family protein [Candidatus Woesearchaeota archaeon]